MRRFWKEVALVAADGGHDVHLDGKPVRTPGRAPLTLPNPALAEAVAEEWRGVGETIDPRAMPLTGLANAAIDRIAPDPAAFAAGLAKYGESDLLCYRADHPLELQLRQAASWDPLLGWAQERYGAALIPTTGIVHVAQPAESVTALANAVAARSAFELAGLSPIVTVTPTPKTSGPPRIWTRTGRPNIGATTRWRSRRTRRGGRTIKRRSSFCICSD